jgi:hypothetical protein
MGDLKLQFVVRPGPAVDPDRFAGEVVDRLAPRLAARDPAALKLTFTAALPPRLAVIPFRRGALALISAVPRPDDDDPEEWARSIGELLGPARVDGYRVVESTPRAYARGWPDGTRTPGAGLLTLFNRRRGQPDAQFFRAWHGVHTPLSLRLHPLWNYVRNVVAEPATAGTPRLDAIVEEHFRTREDLLNPVRFFGGPLAMVPNMARVALDIRNFIDLPSMETWLVDELHVRSA